MKLFLVWCSLCVLAFAESDKEHQEKFNKYLEACAEESQVDKTVLNDFVVNGIAVDDPKLRTQALCFAKKINVMNESGQLETQRVTEKLQSQITNKDEVKKLVETCLVQKDTPENTAAETLKCLKRDLPKGVVLF